MAQTCIFCGRELGFFTRQNITCGGVEQPACSQCYEMLRDLSLRERGERALATGPGGGPGADHGQSGRGGPGGAGRPGAAGAGPAGPSARDRTCLRCGGPMERCGRKLFHLGDEGLFGPVARDGLFASWAGGGRVPVRQLRLGGVLPPRAAGGPRRPGGGAGHLPRVRRKAQPPHLLPLVRRPGGGGRGGPPPRRRAGNRQGGPSPPKKPERKPPGQK